MIQFNWFFEIELYISFFDIKFLTRVRDMPKSVGIDSVITFSNLPNFFFILTFK